MLADAGASDLAITLYVPQGRYLNDFTVGEAVAGMLRDVGVDVTVKPPTDFRHIPVRDLGGARGPQR